MFNFMRAMSDDIKQSVNNRFDNNDIKLNEMTSEFNCKFDELRSCLLYTSRCV